jgi:hypothetical protein
MEAANGNGERHGVPETSVYYPDRGRYGDDTNGRVIGQDPERAIEPARPRVEHGTPLHLTPQQHAVLLRGIDPNRIKRKEGQSHLEAWDVRRHLNRIFGFGGWNDETLELVCVREIEHPPGTVKQTRWVSGEKRQVPNDRTIWTVVYRAQIRLTIKNPDGSVGAFFDDGAAGDAVNQPSLGDAHDMAMKTALSQGLKRCAVNLGDQFGMSLYNGGTTDPQVNVTLVGPIVHDGNVVDEAVRSDVVQGEEGAPSGDDEAVAGNGLPTATELRDEAVDPKTSYGRLQQIYRSVHRSRGDHPQLGTQQVVNETGDEEALDKLVYRHMEARKGQREQS